MLQLESALQNIPHEDRLVQGIPHTPQEGTSIQTDHLVVLLCRYFSLMLLFTSH